MFLVGGHFHLSFGSPNDVCVLESIGQIVNEQVLHYAGFTVFLLYIDVVPINLTVEDSFGNVQLR